MRQLFDNLDDGVAIVSPEAILRYANKAALKVLPATLGEILPADNIRHQLQAARAGYVKLPLSVEIDAPGHKIDPDRLRATLLPAPVGDDYVLLLSNITESQLYENTVGNLAEILQVELADPVERFVDAVDALRQHLGAQGAKDLGLSQTLLDGLARDGALIAARLPRLALLARSFSHAPMLRDERMVVGDLVSEAFARAKSTLRARRIRVGLSGINEQLPVVYGSPSWLGQALGEYIEHLAGNTEQGSELRLSAHASGNFVTLHLASEGFGIANHLRERVFLPFNPNRAADEADQAGEHLSLGMALCKRIVELHGGHVRLTGNNDEITEIAIELPTGGLRARDTPQAGIDQAQRYARDLATLMQRQLGAAHRASL
jgi:signal transduction histidine kinase